MSQRSITVTFDIPDDFLQTAALENIRASLERHAGSMAYVIGAKATVEDPPSKVSYEPCIMGKIEVGGQASEFMIPLDNDSVNYTQWGADNMVLWPRVELVEGMTEKAREWWLDNRPSNDNEGDES